MAKKDPFTPKKGGLYWEDREGRIGQNAPKSLFGGSKFENWVVPSPPLKTVEPSLLL